LDRLFDVPLSNRGIFLPDPRKLKCFSAARGDPVPEQFQERRLMRKHDDLRARLATLENLVDSMISAKTVHARERIIKDHYLRCAVRILFELCQKKRQCKCTPVAGAQRIPKAWPVCRRCRIA